jgi:HlyD family secretion protein
MNLWTVPLAALFCASCALNSDKPDGSGTMECTQIRIASEVAGRIASLAFAEGDTVTNGQLLATLDNTPYRLRRDEALAALALAQAQLDLMNAGSRNEDILRASAQVNEARAMAKAASLDSRRIEALFNQKSVSTKQRDDAATAAERTAAGLAAAEQQLNRLVKGNRPEEIQAAQASVALANARLAQADKAIADCIITAPTTGIITTKTAESGEMTAVGAPLATLSRMDEVWLSLYLPETKLAGIKIGRKATVKIDGDPSRYEGTVTFVSPEAEFTPRNIQTPDERVKLVYRIKVTLPNPKGIFKPGMPADGYL